MSRLYRGISIETNEWVYGGIYELMQGDCLCTYITIPEFDFVPCVNKSIGQNTGLQDKNGVDLFAGDLIKNERGRTGLIVWHVPTAGFDTDYVSDDGSWHGTGQQYGFVCNQWGMHVEKIGDKYSNPELLEQSECN